MSQEVTMSDFSMFKTDSEWDKLSDDAHIVLVALLDWKGKTNWEASVATPGLLWDRHFGVSLRESRVLSVHHGKTDRAAVNAARKDLERFRDFCARSKLNKVIYK